MGSASTNQPPRCSSHRRVGPHDRIVRPAQALSLIGQTMAVPRRDETIVLLLGADRRGLGLISVSGTSYPDDVIEVVELLTAPAAHGGRADALVLASVWAHSDATRYAAAIARDDLDRWFELNEIADHHGVVLLEWFIVDDQISSRRADIGAPSRW